MADAPERTGSRGRSATRNVVIAAVATGLLVLAALLVLHGRGGGTLPGWLSFMGPADAGLLNASSPDEGVLRTLRLCGYEHAVVGAADGTIVVRLDVPTVGTAADVELSWQTALGAALGAYPDADRYVAQVFAEGDAFVEVGIDGPDLRDAASTETPAWGLREHADIILLTADPPGATPMPVGALAMDVDVSGFYLDAKNRAAGLLGWDGPSEPLADLAATWDAARAATVLPVAPADQDATFFYATRLLESLATQGDVTNASGLADEVVQLLGRSGAVPDAALLKRWSHVAAATGMSVPSADVVADALEVAELVSDRPIPGSGPEVDAILVWADHESAPIGSRDSTRFEREPSRDAPGIAGGSSLVGRVLGRYGEEAEDSWTLWWHPPEGGTASVAPDTWTASVGPDGQSVWLAGSTDDVDVALVDGTLRGWAFVVHRALLVEAQHIGHVVEVFDLE